jgi:hypothetical protein
MKFTLLSSIMIALGYTILLLLLASWFGAGYVQVMWLGWYVQSSAVFFLVLPVLFSLLLLVVLAWVRRRQRNISQANSRHISHLKQLRWFEQLGYLSLLRVQPVPVRQIDPQHIQYVFSHSALLNRIIQAKLAREAGEYAQARALLAQASPNARELACIEEIRLLLDEKRFADATACLLRLQEQPASAFIESLAPSYQQCLNDLWLEIARQAPWSLVSTAQYFKFDVLQQTNWIKALQAAFAQSDDTQQQAVVGIYQQDVQQFNQQQDIDKGKAWWALLRLMPETLALRQQLVDQLQKIQFDPYVFKCWLGAQLEREGFPSDFARQHVNDLLARYPAQPSLALASYYIYQAEHHPEQADAILNVWQHDTEFAYLRLRRALADQPELLADLSMLYQALPR